MEQRARLTDLVDSALIAGSFLHKLNDEEKIQRLNVVVELSRSFLLDVGSKDEIENVILRLWAGCMSAAKVIAPSNKSGPNILAIRIKVFSQKIDILCQTDPIYKAGVETAPSFKNLEERHIHLKEFHKILRLRGMRHKHPETLTRILLDINHPSFLH